MKKMHSRYEIQEIAKTVTPTSEKIGEIAVGAVYQDLSYKGTNSNIWKEVETCIDETIESASDEELSNITDLAQSVTANTEKLNWDAVICSGDICFEDRNQDSFKIRFSGAVIQDKTPSTITFQEILNGISYNNTPAVVHDESNDNLYPAFFVNVSNSSYLHYGDYEIELTNNNITSYTISIFGLCDGNHTDLEL